jgi:hypothetical protein
MLFANQRIHKKLIDYWNSEEPYHPSKSGLSTYSFEYGLDDISTVALV